MKRLLLVCSVLIIMTPTYLSAQTIVPGGNVSGTWTAAGSPYLVQGDITVPADSVLNIGPGVSVIFQGAYAFTVSGYLEAIGTEADSIHFTPVTTWSGLRFVNAPDSSHLAYCTVSGVAVVAGVSCSSSNPVITHSRISDNHGIAQGGLYLANSHATISYCTISNNTSGLYGDGGGISIAGSNPQISHCDIFGNHTSGNGRGAGIAIGGGGNPSLDHCTIHDNHAASFGGGIYIAGSPQVTITDCIINADSALSWGGGIYVSSSTASVTINNSTISNCVGYSGGGAYIYQAATVSMTNCAFESNVSSSTLGGGSAIYIAYADTVSLTSSTLDGNNCWGGEPGGVIYSANCDNLILDHCDVVNNRAPIDEGGIRLNGNTGLTVVNSIFRHQQGYHLWFDSYSSASITYSDFFDPGGSYAFFGSVPPGLGVIDTVNANGDSCDVYSNVLLDPLFVDFANGNYHLTATSPCIDAGDPAYPLDPDNTISDMGVWYFHQSPLIFSSDSLLDFGIVDIGQQMDLPLTIRNDGTVALRLQNVSNQDSVFTHNWNPADSLILPNDSLSITVTFMPVDTNLIVDTLLLENNDRPLQVGLSGKGKTVVGIEDQSELPKVYALYPAYPNPFNPATTIRFDLPKNAEVQLIVYDILGRKVATLVNKKMPAGRYEVAWNAANCGSGLYFYQLAAGNFNEVRKVLLVK